MDKQTPSHGDMKGQFAALRDQVAANRTEIDALKARADAANHRADESEARADQSEARADQSEARAHESRERIDQLEVRVDVDREMIAELQSDGVLSRQHAEQMDAALRSSRTIGAAIGIVMANRQVSEDAAFEI